MKDKKPKEINLLYYPKSNREETEQISPQKKENMGERENSVLK